MLFELALQAGGHLSIESDERLNLHAREGPEEHELSRDTHALKPHMVPKTALPHSTPHPCPTPLY